MSKFRRKLIVFGVAFAFVMCLVGMIVLAFFQKDKYMGSKDLYEYYTSREFDTLPAEARKNCVVEDEIHPMRGVIYDDQERPLVTDVRVYPIGIDGKRFAANKWLKSDSPYLDTLIADCARRFYEIFQDRYPNRDVAYYKKRFARAMKDHKWVMIFSEDEVLKDGKMVFEKDLDAIRELPVFSGTIEDEDKARYGIITEGKVRFQSILDLGTRQLTARLRPYGDMAGRVLGSPEAKNGIDGCALFTDILAGESGMRKRLYINGISVPLQIDNPPMEGGNLYTTLNIDIQKIVHTELMAKSLELRPDWACAIVMETATGDIKAISNFMLDTTNGEVSYREVRNFAMVADAAEPGSTFKLATLLAYLEQTNCDTTRRYSINTHTFTARGHKYTRKDSHGGGEVTNVSIKEIMQRSSNVGVAMMARDAFPRYADYVRRLDSLYITVGYSAQIGKLKPLAGFRPETKIFEEQYPTYFGAAFNMQPMQTLVYYNAVANGGRMVQPRFVRYATCGKKTIEYPVEVIREQIASPKTIHIAQSYLKAVAMERPGTAFPTRQRLAPQMEFAGKTGTRDIYHKGAYDKNRNAVSFCGYFPADHPRYTCIVYLYNVVGGSGLAVEVFTKIAKRILFEPKQLDQSQKQLAVCRPVRANDLKRVLSDWKLSYRKPNQGTYWRSSSSNHAVLEPYEVSQSSKIPNVVGLSASDAVFELRRHGLQARISGCGIVRSQSYDPNAKIVLLTLSPG